MAATGILRPSEVVFYHPLNDLTELTQSQAWTGVGGFVAGKIGSAESAVTGDTPTWGTAHSLDGTSTGAGGIVKLDSTRALVFSSVGTDARARVATVSGSDITLGPDATIGTIGGGNAKPRGDFFSTDKVLAHWNNGTTGKLAVVTVSGTDITVGPETDHLSVSGGVASLDSTKGVITYTASGQVRAAVVEISGTSVTVGAATQLSSAAGGGFINNGVARLTDTTAVAIFAEGDNSATNAVVITISGLTLTLGTAVEVAAADGGQQEKNSVIALTSTKVVFLWNVSPTTTIKVGDVAGTVITLGSGLVVEPAVNFSGMAALSSSTFVVCSRRSGVRRVRLLGVSGLSASLGALVTAGAISLNIGVAVAALDGGTTFLHANIDLAAGVLASTADIEAPTPGAYPSTIGNDRVVVAMWAKSLTASGSTVTVERGYSVTMTSTTIELGGTTATWSGGGIATLMGAGGMNDGDSHLLVLDFENTGGTDWTLKTSIDGLAFTLQGTQTSGTQAVTTADTAPSLVIAGGVSGQWVDELVMWAGDKSTFEIFETQELANLNDLAATFGDPMNQYEENFGAPICWQATAKMPDGTPWMDSGSGPCPAVIRVPRGADDIIVTDDGMPVTPRIIEG